MLLLNIDACFAFAADREGNPPWCQRESKAVGLREADDFVDWSWRRSIVNDCVKGNRFPRTIVFSHSPKLIWLGVGNCRIGLMARGRERPTL